MIDARIRPDVLMVFTPASELQQLTTERDSVQNVILEHGGNADVRFGFDLDFLRIIQEQKSQTLTIFHYAGHASPEGIEHEIEENGEKKRETLLYADLADYLEKSFKNLKLVFINGCNSENAARFFLRKADALICTTRPIDDKEATTFARNFYSNFLKINDLENAFTSTRSFVALSGGRGAGFSRAAMSTAKLTESANADPSVYELKFRDNNPEIGKSTFESWRNTLQPSLTQAKETTITAKNMGVSPHAYLRCNRESQESLFKRGLRKKMKNQIPQPLFVFIHGLENHCPADLFDRFVNYTFADELGLNRTPTEIELPKNPDLADLDWCQDVLLENYCRQGKFGQADANRNWILSRQVPDNQWIVIRHKLSDGKWQPNWGLFFDNYITQFGKELADKMSEKLIIVTTRTTNNENDEFAQYFANLANDPTRQVVNLTGFDKITQQDIIVWQEAVFGDTKFLSSEIIGNNEEKFFFDIKELLKAKLT